MLVRFVVRTILCSAAMIAFNSIAVAQMTIFNVPTSDTLPRSSFFIEADLIIKPTSYDKGGFQTYAYRTVYGVDNKTDIGANFFITRDGGDDTVADLQFNIKRNIYRNETIGVAASVGAIVSTPLRDQRGSKAYLMTYATASKKIKATGGTNITGGVYQIFWGGDDFGDKTGAIIGLEQPIYKRLSFVADWYSGKNRLGYSSAGLNLNITKRQFVLAGYSFGNSGRGNNSLNAFWGYTF